MRIITNDQLERLLATEREQGLSDGYRLGYQAGITEGIHRMTLVRAQINQILKED